MLREDVVAEQQHEATLASVAAAADSSSASRHEPHPLELEGGDAIFRNDESMSFAFSQHQRQHRKKCRRCRSVLPAFAVIGALLLAAIITAVAFPRKGNAQHSSSASSSSQSPNHPPLATTTTAPSSVPTPLSAGVTTPTPTPAAATPVPSSGVSRMQAFWNLLLNHSISSEFYLHEPSSPQYQALSWIANVDPAKLDVSTTPWDVIVTRYILAAVYLNNGGPDWTVDANFLSGLNICFWQDASNTTGVLACDPFLHIRLASNNLNSTILSELGRLSTLQHLDLTFNALNGTIPSTLAMLPNLTYLGLGYNQFHGSIFTEVGALTNLQYLNLTSDQLTGLVPSEISMLSSSLLQLDISSNGFHGTIPNFLGQLAQLQILDLSTNSFSGTVPSILASLSHLTSLSVQNNVKIGGNMTTSFCNRSWTVLGSNCASTVDCRCCTACYN